MRDLFTVASFTMKEMIKRKSFIISNIIIIVLILVGFNVPNIIKAVSGDSLDGNGTCYIIDSENVFEGNLEELNNMDLGYIFSISNDEVNRTQIKEKIDSGEITEGLVISKLDDGKINMEYIVNNLIYIDSAPETLINAISSVYTNLQLSKLNLSSDIITSITPNFNIEVSQTDEEEVQGNVFAVMLLSIVLFYAIYFCAFQVSSSITTEKTSKIIETLVTSTSPKLIVLGKTIGIGLVGLVQVIILIGVALFSANNFLEPSILENLINVSQITPFLGVMVIVYFLLGYFMFALLYALTGSTVSKPEDIQSANTPIALLAVIGFYLSYFTMMNPTSDLNKVAAIVPISSPFCMPFRIMMGLATNIEIIASIVVLVLTILVVARISIKIYSNAILNYGSKMSIKDIVKVYKEKNM